MFNADEYEEEKEISLDAACDRLIQKIEEMRKHYKEEHEKEPDNWPMEMYEGDWLDQFLSYI